MHPRKRNLNGQQDRFGDFRLPVFLLFRSNLLNQSDFNFSPEGKRLLEIVLEKDDASEEARAQLESALRDRKIALSLKRLIDGDPTQELVF